MESTPEYLARKTRELQLLARYAGHGAPDLAAPTDPAELIERKFRLRADILAHQARSSWEVTETNWHGREWTGVGAHRVKYGYQRFDLVVRARAVYPLLRRPERVSWQSGVAYAGSGMAAIAVVLLALDHLALDGRPIVLHALQDSYFETLHLARISARAITLVLHETPAALVEAVALEPPGHTVVVLVDSICGTPWSGELAGLAVRPPEVVLFDTTCFELASDAIDAVVDTSAAFGAPLVLLRSHVKLDSLGIEYARLGSASFVRPPGVSAVARRVFSRLLLRYRDISCRIGARTSHHNLPPFADDPEFHVLNQRRLQRIEDGTCALADLLGRRLDGAGFRVRTYPHRKYLTIEPPEEVTREDILDRIPILAREAHARGVPACRADSFGFDFFGLTDFIDLGRGRHVVRVAAPDLPDPLVAEMADALGTWCVAQWPGGGR